MGLDFLQNSLPAFFRALGAGIQPFAFCAAPDLTGILFWASAGMAAAAVGRL